MENGLKRWDQKYIFDYYTLFVHAYKLKSTISIKMIKSRFHNFINLTKKITKHDFTSCDCV